MNNELDKKLCEDFPEIFRDRHGNMRTTAMCWGFSCGDGWEPLIRATCNRIMSDITKYRTDIININEMLAAEDKQKWDKWMTEFYTKERAQEYNLRVMSLLKEVPVAVQVKEKFGGLRFYVHGGTTATYDLIHHAEVMSYYICEECSVMAGTVLYRLGWMRTLCPSCADKNYGTEAADFRNKTGEWAE